MSEQRQEFAPVVPYFSASGGSKLDQLRRRVQTGEREVRDAVDWSQRTRREAELAVTRRELESVEHDARQVQQGGTAQQADAAPCTLDGLVASGHYIKSGNTYLQVRNKPQRRPKAEYAVPTPYWETAKA